MAQSTKKINCSECGETMVVDASAISGTCWSCLGKVVSQVAKKKSEVAVMEKETDNNAKQSARAGHMTPEAIRKRFDVVDPSRKAGFFQEVFSIIKSGETDVKVVAERAFKLDSKPSKYEEVADLEKQIRWYSKGVWGKRSNLVELVGDTVTYLGGEQ